MDTNLRIHSGGEGGFITTVPGVVMDTNLRIHSGEGGFITTVPGVFRDTDLRIHSGEGGFITTVPGVFRDTDLRIHTEEKVGLSQLSLGYSGTQIWGFTRRRRWVYHNCPWGIQGHRFEDSLRRRWVHHNCPWGIQGHRFEDSLRRRWVHHNCPWGIQGHRFENSHGGEGGFITTVPGVFRDTNLRIHTEEKVGLSQLSLGYSGTQIWGFTLERYSGFNHCIA